MTIWKWRCVDAELANLGCGRIPRGGSGGGELESDTFGPNFIVLGGKGGSSGAIVGSKTGANTV